MNKSYYPILFISFVLGYFFLYGFYGYNDADEGYNLALAWRIFCGEIPYKDFMSIRPPLTPILHALPLFIIPEQYQILFERVLAYVLFASTSLFCALTLDTLFDFKKYSLDPYLFATVGFVFSVNHFPPMAWYTVDGLFFAALGTYLLTRFPKVSGVIFGILALFLSALTKQPFYLMPVAGCIYVWLLYKDKKLLSIALVSTFAFFSLFFILLYVKGALLGFLAQTSESLKIKDLLSAGILSYIRYSSIIIVVPIAFWVLLKRLSRTGRGEWLIQLAPFFLISFILAYPLSKFVYSVYIKKTVYNSMVSHGYADSVGIVLFLITVFVILTQGVWGKKWFGLCFLVFISWCASISWGHKRPDLFSTPLLFGFFVASYHYFEVKRLKLLVLYTLLAGTITYCIAYQKPYCNPPRWYLTYEISDIFPKLNKIKVGYETHEKYHELKYLIDKYGSNFKTMPGMPLANYLSNTKSPIILDWVSNGETNNKNECILQVFRIKKPYVFLEKRPQVVTISRTGNFLTSTIADYIKNNIPKIDSTKYFDVYRIL